MTGLLSGVRVSLRIGNQRLLNVFIKRQHRVYIVYIETSYSLAFTLGVTS